MRVIGKRALSGAVLLAALLAFAGISAQGRSAGKGLEDGVRQKALDTGERRAGKPVTVRELRRNGPRSFSARVTWIKRNRSGFRKCSLGIRLKRSDKGLRATGRRVSCQRISLWTYLDIQFQRGPGPKYCPGNSGETWNAKPALVGKSLKKATAIARRHECAVRVVRRDGVDFPVTADLIFRRLNVAVKGPDKRVVRIFDVG